MTSVYGGVAATVLALVVASAQNEVPAPLPESRPFLEAVRRHLAQSQEDQRLFAYRERRTDLNLNPFGHLGTKGSRVVEVTPLADGAQMRRLLERDGVAVPDSQPTRREPRPSRGRSIVEDVVSVIDVAISHREVVDGQSSIVMQFQARPGAKPRTREGRIARAFTGLIWVDEQAAEVTKIEATAVDDISFGFGMLARLNEGAKVFVAREMIDDGVWMPTSMRFTGDGRALLFFRKLEIDFAVDWFGYRRVL